MRRCDTVEEYSEALRDGRTVFLDGERARRCRRTHPAFAEPIRRIAERYDEARETSAQSVTTCLDPETGHEAHACRGDVAQRPAHRAAAHDLGHSAAARLHRFWAEASYGLMGRTPDHVACVITAFATARDFFAQGGRRVRRQRRALPSAGAGR